MQAFAAIDFLPSAFLKPSSSVIWQSVAGDNLSLELVMVLVGSTPRARCHGGSPVANPGLDLAGHVDAGLGDQLLVQRSVGALLDRVCAIELDRLFMPLGVVVEPRPDWSVLRPLRSRCG